MMESMLGISQRYNAVIALVDDENVSQEDVNMALMEVMDDIKSKGENGINYLNSLQATIEEAKANKKRLDAWIKTLEGRKKRVEKAYLFALENMGMKSIMTGMGELKAKKNPPATIIDDLTQIPTKFQRQKIQVDVDKIAIKAAIKAGETVPGAHLEQAISLSY